MKKIFYLKNKKAFTLIELLIVVGLIGILASIAIVPLNNSKMKARDARRITELRQIHLALLVYAESNDGRYPDTLEGLGVILPKDPTTGENYFYCSSGTAGGENDGTSFHLGTVLERTPDPYLESDGDIETDNCENLPGNPSFHGNATRCSGSAACTTGECEDCYDLGPLDKVPGDEGGGSGEDGGEDGGEGEEPPSLAPQNLNISRNYSYKLDLYWQAPDIGNVTGYVVHVSGYLWTGSTWANTSKTFNTNSLNYQVTSLYPNKTYTFFVEAIGESGTATPSEPITVTMVPVCPDGSCDDGEFCFNCQRDCGNCPQPLDFYRTHPYYGQFFPQ